MWSILSLIINIPLILCAYFNSKMLHYIQMNVILIYEAHVLNIIDFFLLEFDSIPIIFGLCLSVWTIQFVQILVIALFIHWLPRSPIWNAKKGHPKLLKTWSLINNITNNYHHDLPYTLHIKFNGAIKQHSLKSKVHYPCTQYKNVMFIQVSSSLWTSSLWSMNN